MDRVSISPLISPPIQRTSHLRATVGTLRAYLIRPRLRLRIRTPPLRGRSSRRGLSVSRKTLWISLQGKIRGRTCRRPCKVRVSTCFDSLYVIGCCACFILEFPNRERDEHGERVDGLGLIYRSPLAHSEHVFILFRGPRSLPLFFLIR